MKKETNWHPLLERFSQFQDGDKQQQYYRVLYLQGFISFSLNVITGKCIVFYIFTVDLFFLLISMLTFQKTDKKN